MHLDNLTQYDEFRIPKDSKFLDNQDEPDMNDYSDGADYEKLKENVMETMD